MFKQLKKNLKCPHWGKKENDLPRSRKKKRPPPSGLHLGTREGREKKGEKLITHETRGVGPRQETPPRT